MITHRIRYASIATLALSLAACSGAGSSGATAVVATVAAPPPSSAMFPRQTGSIIPTTSPSTKPTEFVTGTLCTRPDQVVFSCPLEKTNKIVSICAAGDAAPHRFYYAFGRANTPELVYPTKGSSAAALNRTGQIYAGGMGSEEYSFHRDGFEYITFTLSGKGFRDAGILVRQVGADQVTLHLSCDQTRLIETKNRALDDELLQLKPEPDLKDGLPYYPPKENQ